MKLLLNLPNETVEEAEVILKGIYGKNILNYVVAGKGSFRIINNKKVKQSTGHQYFLNDCDYENRFNLK